MRQSIKNSILIAACLCCFLVAGSMDYQDAVKADSEKFVRVAVIENK